MKKYFTLFLFYSLLSLSLVASQNKSVADSLILLASQAKSDTVKVDLLNQVSYEYLNFGQYSKAKEFADKARSLSENANYKKGIASALNSTGMASERQGNYVEAKELYLKALAIWKELKNKVGIGNVFINLGNIYTNEGNYEEALKFYYKSLAIWEEIDSKKGMANVYINIGNIYLSQKKYEFALRDYFKVLKIWEEKKEQKGIADICNNLGNAYHGKGQLDEALTYQLRALKIREKIGDMAGLANSYNNVGLIYMEQNDFKKALDNHFKSLKISEEIGNKQGLGNSYCNIGLVYIEQKRFDEAELNLQKSLEKFKEIGFKEAVKEVLFSFSSLYEKKGDYKKAFDYRKLFTEIKDSLLNEQMSKQITEMDVKYDSERKDKELIKKDAEIVRQQTATERKNLQRNAFIIGFIFVLALAFFIFRSYNQKKVANLLLEEKNELIDTQKKLVEEKNIKITDSITYAKRIQQATLPSEDAIKLAFPDSFVLFLPKDIVSGDFYWYAELQAFKCKLIVVADCTGHGVPGAFMSMIGNTLLNEIVNIKGIHSPAEILTELNKGIVNLLNQNIDTAETQDDGMDVTVVAVNTETNAIEYAAANHFSYLITENHVNVLKGDVYSVGGMFGKGDMKFTNHSLTGVKGSMLYLFTDGFMDQFGGEKNGKFTSARFETVLLTMQNRTTEAQRTDLKTEFENWKGQNKQLDDILIVGLRL